MRFFCVWSTLCLLTISLPAQTMLGITGFAGSSSVIQISSNWSLGSGALSFWPGFNPAIMASISYNINEEWRIKTDIGYSHVRGPGRARNIPAGVMTVDRVILPIEIHYLKGAVLGGFLGIENHFNLNHSVGLISYLTVPYSCSISGGLSYSLNKSILTSLYYSIEISPFAQAPQDVWTLLKYEYSHFHFGIIGLKVSYFPWEL